MIFSRPTPGHQLHAEQPLIGGFVDLLGKDLHDVGVLEPGHRAAFAALIGRDFESDFAIERYLPGEIDVSERALAEHADDFEIVDLLAGQQGGRPSVRAGRAASRRGPGPRQASAAARGGKARRGAGDARRQAYTSDADSESTSRTSETSSDGFGDVLIRLDVRTSVRCLRRRRRGSRPSRVLIGFRWTSQR